jgi:hypothetical protein
VVEEPPFEEISPGHRVACWNYEEVPELEMDLVR